VFYLALGPEDQVYADPQQVSADADAFPRPVGRASEFATIELNGEPTRVSVRRMPDGGRLIVGQSLAPELNALDSLLLVLLGGGGLGVLLSLVGAWFLAGRALVPVQQAFRRQQEFVADASHELRTPLTVLQSATDVLNRHRAEPLEANGELFDDVRMEIARMERLAADLLTLARSDRGELELAVAPVNAGALAAEVVRRTEPLARERGVELVIEQEATPPTEADPDRIQQTLLILLGNALKHTPPGGRVVVRVCQHGTDVLLEVEDTGTGIEPEHLAHIFDRFYRADRARSRGEGGTGLGLAIAKTLVEAHHGALSVSSTPGTGTRATVRLPLTPGAPLSERLGGLVARLAHGTARSED
jgi:signal transduction histidine kinase